MKIKTLKNLLAACSVALCTPLASASIITYDFTDVDHKFGYALGESAQFTEHDLTVTVSAWHQDGDDWANNDGREVWHDGYAYGAKGLGVKLPYSADNWEIDGLGPNEGLKFSFDWEVELTSIQTWFGDRNDDWNLSVRGEDGWDLLLDDSSRATYNDSIYAQEFIVWADHSGDSFTLKNIVVHHEKVSVAEPSTFALLGLGLTGLLLSRRRN